MAREINLVPTSKFEAIKAIRLRNFLLFLSIAVAGGAIAVVFVLGTILGGQGLILEGKDNMLNLYSKKINSYTELTDFLTIKDQLGKLRTLADNKKIFSRTFNLLPIFIPTNGDDVNFSKVNIDLVNQDEENPTDNVRIYVEAQANANKEPYIDYNVLDAFKKAMDYYRYDFGTYVNELGDTIPSYCIIEKDDNGAFLHEEGKFYAYWTAKADGCDPRHPVDLLSEEDEDEESVATEDGEEAEMEYNYTSYNGLDVVRIWRTPQFDEWYNDEYMSLDGSISGIPHFESSCISYIDGALDERTNKVYFNAVNEDCRLIPDGAEGFRIEESSNGRGEDNELILSFKGQIFVTPEYYRLQNTHMMAVAPSGRFNVTDSYMQIQSLFVPPAEACDFDDLECRNGGK